MGLPAPPPKPSAIPTTGVGVEAPRVSTAGGAMEPALQAVSGAIGRAVADCFGIGPGMRPGGGAPATGASGGLAIGVVVGASRTADTGIAVSPTNAGASAADRDCRPTMIGGTLAPTPGPLVATPDAGGAVAGTAMVEPDGFAVGVAIAVSAGLAVGATGDEIAGASGGLVIGVVVGATVGVSAVGAIIGATVGASGGLAVGSAVGAIVAPVGATVGLTVGVAVSEAVSAIIGAVVGGVVDVGFGRGVGEAVAAIVDATVGASGGLAVGSVVGAIVGALGGVVVDAAVGASGGTSVATMVVGTVVGPTACATVGLAVGSTVGAIVGASVGLAVAGAVAGGFVGEAWVTAVGCAAVAVACPAVGGMVGATLGVGGAAARTWATNSSAINAPAARNANAAKAAMGHRSCQQPGPRNRRWHRRSGGGRDMSGGLPVIAALRSHQSDRFDSGPRADARRAGAA